MTTANLTLGSGTDPAADPTTTTLSIPPDVFYDRQFKAAFETAHASGRLKPLVFPISFLGSVILPVLYLSVPHTTRPWLYRLRWAVAAAVVALNVRLMQTTSAANEAIAYGTGLIAVWGTIWALRMLIFTRPQWEAARIVRVPKGEAEEGREKKVVKADVALDESVAAALEDYDYVWQPYPARAPFLTRLGWSIDLLICFRGAGWNLAISSIPQPPPPSPRLFRSKQPILVQIASIPLHSRTGIFRSQTYASFLRDRLFRMLVSWMVLDVLTITLRKDPYFIFGPEPVPSNNNPFPSILPSDLMAPTVPEFLPNLPLKQYTLPLLRNACALAGIWSGLEFYTSIAQLAFVFLPLLLVPRRLRGAWWPGTDLWANPSLFGNFVSCVLDKGLRGFWSGWWHQTFRAGFLAGPQWALAKGQSKHKHGHGEFDATAVIQILWAFLLSGLLHGAGGHTSSHMDRPAGEAGHGWMWSISDMAARG
ncbi:uncharacterized protein CTHT_0053630 [Thermochaetoides thermophila DSM 1495]|uniref:Wax synthase domain-containing protein n=1 Tax=Chaetomium thermophilum (strain DSM 1495 / CBS 144.50 / IMI 039719) TaxID=759272 RepID=G0SBH8_CHATD|nr:hypothetical protein CTHT_0053630 [Thermochaetoides thermophila DSM 1495]EGS18754.1 hypothetical protein CTHT_0053630 [Thermochaetoides thermophila DSM 1495]